MSSIEAKMTTNDSKIVKCELFDVNVLTSLLLHDGVSREDKLLLKAYKKRRVNGNSVQVIYEYGKLLQKVKKGRLYPQKGLGLQNFPSDIRGALASKYYWDIDIINSQPSILYQMAVNNGWVCSQLKDYIDNRASKLTEIMECLGCDRDSAKTVCIATMFGAKYSKAPQFIKDLASELELIGKNIVINSPLSTIYSKPGQAQSIVATTLQDIEFNLLQQIEKYFNESNRVMGVYIHDGGLMERLQDEKEFPEELLRGAEKHILDTTGYSIKLAQKSLTHTFTFKNNLMRTKFVSEAEYNERKENFEKNHFYLNQSSGVVCTVEDDGSTTLCKVTSAPTMFSSYNFQHTVDNLIHTTEFIPIWLKDTTKYTKKAFVFKPQTSYIPNDDEYNIYTGLQSSFEVEPTSYSKKEIIECYELLNRIIANHNEEMITYLRHWDADMIQNPGSTPGVAIVAINKEHGVGKDFKGSFIGKWLIGSKYYRNIRNVETELFEKHSNALNGKLFLKLEEVLVPRSCANQLKGLVVATNTTINPKGFEPYDLDVFVRIFATTNEVLPVKVEKGDRRFCITYTSSEYKGNIEFWEKMNKVLNNSYAGYVVNRYLSAIDLSSFKICEFPRTEYHKNLSDNEVSSEEQFVKDCEPFEEIKGSTLHNLYSNYCRENGMTPKSLVHFCRALAPLIETNLIKKRTVHSQSYYSKDSVTV